jgi:E3 ubiquitin-protein ligase RNF144
LAYVTFEIEAGTDEIACPDSSCSRQGCFQLDEIASLVSPKLMDKHNKFRLYRGVDKDDKRAWCPTPGCETVCHIQEVSLDMGVHTKSKSKRIVNKYYVVNCTACGGNFCADCKLSSHPGVSCEYFRRKLIKQGKLSVEDELSNIESIKKCPFCHAPIEKDSGCAQMMCKNCRHVFCWYCLASLDDDFLLRHYDKGPCKNKLGHSRASVVWHRAQVIGIFAGFGLLILLASPLLVLAAPCLLCCRCRYCAKDDSPSASV